MSSFMFYNNDFSADRGNPTAPQHYYNYLTSIWKNGVHLTYGGNGLGIGNGATNTPTNFMFPGNDYLSGSTPWFDSSLTDKKFVASTGPYNLPSGGELTLEYAIVYSRDEQNPNGLNTSFKKNHDYCMRIKNWYQHNSFPQCKQTPNGAAETSATGFNVYPNPTTGYFTIQLDKACKNYRLAMFNILGQAQDFSVTGSANELRVDATSVLPGMYFLMLETEEGRLVQRVLITE